MDKPITVGAVLYDPRVSVIWQIIADFFEGQGIPLEPVFYSTYELQVDALIKRDIDLAWNSPLAWLDSQRRSGGHCRAIAMRDTDRDRQSYWVVRTDGPVQSVGDLSGRKVAVGAGDSPQATLIPLNLLAAAGLVPERDVQVHRHELLVGKHGDHIGGEREALDDLQKGTVHACAMLDLNWETWTADGTIDPARYRILTPTERFDHCVFTVRDEFPRDVEERWLAALYAMQYDNPKHREMMDLEGLKAWLPGRTTGFGPLQTAVARFDFFLGK